MPRGGAFLTILTVSLALTFATVGASAQEAPILQRGARVRVTLGEPEFNGLTISKSITGKFLDLTATDITLETSAHRPPVVLPLQNVSGLELNVQQGRRNRER